MGALAARGGGWRDGREHEQKESWSKGVGNDTVWWTVCGCGSSPASAPWPSSSPSRATRAFTFFFFFFLSDRSKLRSSSSAMLAVLPSLPSLVSEHGTPPTHNHSSLSFRGSQLRNVMISYCLHKEGIEGGEKEGGGGLVCAL